MARGHPTVVTASMATSMIAASRAGAPSCGSSGSITKSREAIGIACRTFQHTIALLLALEDRLLGRDISHVPTICRRAADATEDLLARRDAWVPEVATLLTSSRQAFVLAPHERLSSAEQGALMLREGPRVPSDACETADWLHVDVYLTRSIDYRALVFVGSPFDADAMGWMRDRGATVCAVGADLADAKATVRYVGDDDPDVALLTETIVPELVAADVWRRA